jgi:hypothetical protein
MKRPAIADHAGPNGVPTTPLRSGYARGRGRGRQNDPVATPVRRHQPQFLNAGLIGLPLAPRSIAGLGHGPDGRGGASGLAAAVFQRSISDRRLAGHGELRAMFLHTLANASSARLDRTAERFDIIHACLSHRTAFGQCKHRNKNPGRDHKTIFCEHETGSFIVLAV